MSDRNQTTAEGRVRLGYQISPALIPFVEASLGRAISDQTLDRNGYNRNANIYAAKAGVQLDFTEKLRGEVAAGYKQVRYFDARLSKIDAFTLDGKVDWSPIRGTDVAFTLATGIEPSTTAGISGSTYYTVGAAVSQQMIDNLVATAAARRPSVISRRPALPPIRRNGRPMPASPGRSAATWNSPARWPGTTPT